jgi:hypothetical protein
MIQQATYGDGSRTVTIAVERIDTWLEEADSIINFPGLLELDGDRLFLTASRSRHGAEWESKEDPFRAYVSEDAGRTWNRAPDDCPLIIRNPHTRRMIENYDSGVTGYLRDGTIGRIDHWTQRFHETKYDRSEGHEHEQFQEENPTFRWHRWQRDGTPIEHFPFKVNGIPWERASYQCYSSLLDLENGDLLTALEWVVMLPEDQQTVDRRGRRRTMQIGVFIVRSSDRGRTWDLVQAFDPAELRPVGPGDRPVDEGFDEADLVVLANGDILCVMRTGGLLSPMFQSRSTDGGHTWSPPVSTGWQGVRPRLQLLPNGVLACAAGRGTFGHPQVTHVMLSLDGTGRHWEAPFCFHTGPGCSYTSTMQRDGKLHVVYSHSDFSQDFGTHGLRAQTIKRAVLDVRLETS